MVTTGMCAYQSGSFDKGEKLVTECEFVVWSLIDLLNNNYIILIFIKRHQTTPIHGSFYCRFCLLLLLLLFF